MRRSAVAILLLAVAAAGWSQPFRVEKTSGVIVEFKVPPITIAAKSAGKTAIASYQATFDRFRNDLGAIVNGNRAGKSAIDVAAQIKRQYFVVFNGVALDASPDVAARIRALPYVKRVVADRAVQAMAGNANITVIHADKVWSLLGNRGKGVTVAIIDTGVDYTHVALGGGFGPGFKVIGGWDFVNNDADPFDDDGHGTHVAGIVAGDSDIITGVAPEAKLLAYKVLDAHGSGSNSDVIAAIERAADPNGDGNTDDHADVANLSLGGPGNPDDPTSTAIDNATAAGVTFAVAAGNSGVFHGIASPGTSRSAITVGASDLTDRMTAFSSRGPNMRNMAIKPDVVAPGLSILSSYPGNMYASLSGTSMATPHVAGAAALLKSLHHDWTPAQIKLALMNNSTVLPDDIMATGAGRLDAYAAATGSIVVDPPAISLGLAPLETNNWTATRTLHLTNPRAQPATFTVKENVAAGEKVTPSQTTITLPAGGSSDLSLTFDVDNSLTQAGAGSFTGGGQIVLTNSALLTDVHYIQFAFTKAARGTATFDRAYPDARWINAARTTLIPASFLDDNTSEALMLPGTWDMLIFAGELDAKTGDLTTVDFIAREALALTKDTPIPLTAADTPHTVTLAGRRETGETLGNHGYVSSGRILIGGTGGTFTALAFPWSAGVHTMHFSDVSSQKTLLFYEALLDTDANNYYMIQHPPLKGLTTDISLTTGGSVLRGGSVQFAVPAASLGDRRLLALVGTTSGSGGLPFAEGIVDAPVVNARVFVSPDVQGFTYGLSFIAITDDLLQYTTPMLRVSNDKLVAPSAAGLLPWTYSGTTYQFGLGPRFPGSTINSTLTHNLNFFTEILGPLGEGRIADRVNTVTTITDARGTRLFNGGYSGTCELGPAGDYRIDVTNQGSLYPGVNKTTTSSMTINSSRKDFLPPTLTTMMMLDGSGTVVTRLEPHSSGSLLFSAADFTLNSSGIRTYQSIRGDATQVSYRYTGETVWRPLTATQVTEDATSGSGILYRIDLTSVANVDRGLVDLKFELVDAALNATSVTMVPAFSVGPEILPKHRSSR